MEFSNVICLKYQIGVEYNPNNAQNPLADFKYIQKINLEKYISLEKILCIPGALYVA